MKEQFDHLNLRKYLLPWKSESLKKEEDGTDGKGIKNLSSDDNGEENYFVSALPKRVLKSTLANAAKFKPLNITTTSSTTIANRLVTVNDVLTSEVTPKLSDTTTVGAGASKPVSSTALLDSINTGINYGLVQSITGLTSGLYSSAKFSAIDNGLYLIRGRRRVDECAKSIVNDALTGAVIGGAVTFGIFSVSTICTPIGVGLAAAQPVLTAIGTVSSTYSFASLVQKHFFTKEATSQDLMPVNKEL